MIRMRVAMALLVGCAGALGAQAGAATSASAGLVPEGFGSRKQDEIAVKLQNLGLLIKAIPLDEAILRLLAPDSHRALRSIRESRAKQLEAIAARTGVARVQAWYVTYYTLEPGEARYEPMDVVLRSGGRDYRPLDVMAVTPGFGEGRVAQRQQQSAIFVYDASIDLSQPVTVLAAGQQSTGWTETLSLLDAERSAVWSRSSAGTQKKP